MWVSKFWLFKQKQILPLQIFTEISNSQKEKKMRQIVIWFQSNMCIFLALIISLCLFSIKKEGGYATQSEYLQKFRTLFARVLSSSYRF